MKSIIQLKIIENFEIKDQSIFITESYSLLSSFCKIYCLELKNEKKFKRDYNSENY
jgi:hypothetical protein